MSSRLRIVLGMLLLGIIGITGVLRWVTRELRPHYLKSMEESLVDESVILASLLSSSLIEGKIDVSLLTRTYDHASARKLNANIYDLKKTSINSQIYVTNAKGILLFDTRGDSGADYSQWHDVYKTLRGEYGARTTRINQKDTNSTMLYVAAPIMSSDTIIGSITIGKPAKSANYFIQKSRQELSTMVLYMALFLLVLTLFFTHWVTIPIRRLTHIAQAVANGSSRAKIDTTKFGKGRQNEFLQLAIALEEMRESLAGQRYVEHYIQSMTHEIKSPLTAIRGAVELIDENMPPQAQAKFLTNIKNESQRITTIIEKLLQLSTLEHQYELNNPTTIDLNQSITDAVTALAPLLQTKAITLTPHYCTQPISFQGEAFLIEQACINIIGNAIDFTPENGTITIALSTTSNTTTLTITDSGTGFEEYALSRVFERFYSLPRPITGRKSSGLGLPFVKEVIELHGGSVSVNNSMEEGVIKGAVVTVLLPNNA